MEKLQNSLLGSHRRVGNNDQNPVDVDAKMLMEIGSTSVLHPFNSYFDVGDNTQCVSRFSSADLKLP